MKETLADSHANPLIDLQVIDALLGGASHPSQMRLSPIRPSLIRTLWREPLSSVSSKLSGDSIHMLEQYVLFLRNILTGTSIALDAKKVSPLQTNHDQLDRLLGNPNLDDWLLLTYRWIDLELKISADFGIQPSDKSLHVFGFCADRGIINLYKSCLETGSGSGIFLEQVERAVRFISSGEIPEPQLSFARFTFMMARPNARP